MPLANDKKAIINGRLKIPPHLFLFTCYSYFHFLSIFNVLYVKKTLKKCKNIGLYGIMLDKVL